MCRANETCQSPVNTVAFSNVAFNSYIARAEGVMLPHGGRQAEGPVIAVTGLARSLAKYEAGYQNARVMLGHSTGVTGRR